MNTEIFVDNKKVGEFEQSTGTFVFKKRISHLYRTLNSFCVNAEVLSMYDWKNILFQCDFNTEYIISKTEYDKLFNVLNMYISFGNEKQVAIPVAMMNKRNSITKIVDTYGVTVKEFIDEKIKVSPYHNWKNRIDLKYFLGE